jgi:hypothetical protein
MDAPTTFRAVRRHRRRPISEGDDISPRGYSILATLTRAWGLDTYEREYLFNKAHLNVTKITLPDGQSLTTEPVVRSANEAKIDHREGKTFINCQARGGGMFECARISQGGRSAPL